MKNFNHFQKLFLILFIFLFLGIQKVEASASILISPKNEVIQGEPVLIQISGAKISDIKSLTFEKTNLPIFNYKNLPSALLGIDLRAATGTFSILLVLKNGVSTSSKLIVLERQKQTVFMAVPDSLGGNSDANQTAVINDLSQENAILAVLKTGAKAFWTSKFIYPIAGTIIITDPYGFERSTGNYDITHKGVDLHAPTGTKVMAINRGVVRAVKHFQVYGNTVVVDHGDGVMSFYLHLSKINVNVGELVQQGQVIGLSGATGFVTGPHLHLSVRINNISIDPIKFLDLFK